MPDSIELGRIHTAVEVGANVDKEVKTLKRKLTAEERRLRMQLPVIPDTRKFEKDLLTLTRKIEKNTRKIKIPVTTNTSFAELKISELQKLYSETKRKLERQIKIDVKAGDLAKTEAKLNSISRALGRAKTETKDLNRETEKGKLGASSSAREFVKYGGALGIAATAAASLAEATRRGVSGFVQYDAGLRRANTILRVSETQLQSIGGELQNLQKDFGLGGRDLSNALYEAASAGIAAGDSMKFLEVASRAAVGGGNTVTQSVDALTTVLNSYSLSADNASRISDILFTTVERGKTDMRKLSAELADVTAIAAANGVEFTQLAAAIQTMTKQGIKTPEVMTQLKAVILSLNRVLGDGWQESMTFQEALATVEKQSGGSKNKLVKLVGSVEALNAVLATTGKNAKTAAEDLAATRNAFGATTRAFDEQSKSLERRWAQLVQSVNVGLTRAAGRVIQFFDSFKSDDIHQQSRAMDEQRVKVQALGRAIIGTTGNEKARLALIRQIQSEYPGFLGNLSAESITNKQIRDRLKAVNDELKNKIRLQQINEKQIQAARAAVEAEDRLLQASQRAGGAVAGAKELGLNVGDGDLKSQLDNIRRNIGSAIETATRGGNIGLSRGLREVNKVAATASIELSGALKNEKVAKAELEKETSKLIETQKKLGLLDSVATSTPFGGSSPPSGDKSKSAKEFEEQKARIEAASNELFSTLRFDSENYRKVRIEAIDATVAALREGGTKEIEIQRFKSAALKQLNQEERDFKINKIREKLEALRTSGTAEAAIEAEKVKLLNGLTDAEYQYWLATQEKKKVAQQTLLSQLHSDLESSLDRQQIAVDTAQAALGSLFSEFRLKLSRNAGIAERVFEGMANAIIAQISRILVKLALLKIAQFIPGGQVFSVAGGAGLKTGGSVDYTGGTPKITRAKTGGDFFGTRAGIKKANSGANFTVPGGFLGDRFPMLINSGEHVTVKTPAQVQRSEDVLSGLQNGFTGLSRSIRALNLNMMNIQGRQEKVEAEIALRAEISNESIKLANDRAKTRQRTFG